MLGRRRLAAGPQQGRLPERKWLQTGKPQPPEARHLVHLAESLNIETIVLEEKPHKRFEILTAQFYKLRDSESGQRV